MSISFSGLASGLDTDSWVTALVSVKQLNVTTLQNQLSLSYYLSFFAISVEEIPSV